MKLRKILDATNVQGYQIKNPTKRFKTMYPRRYILSLDIMGTHHVINADTIPSNLVYFSPVGYIFTYNNSLPKSLANSLVKEIDVGSTFTRCLDGYFISKGGNDGTKIDLVLSCSPKGNIAPPTFTNELIVRCNSKALMSAVMENSRVHREVLTGGDVDDNTSSVPIDGEDIEEYISDEPQEEDDITPPDERTIDDEDEDEDDGNDFSVDANIDDVLDDVLDDINRTVNASGSRKQLRVTGKQKVSKDHPHKPKPVSTEAMTLRKNIVNIIRNFLSSKKYTVESWVRDVMFNFPVTPNGFPIRYPSSITNENVNGTNINYRDLFIEYDYRAGSIDREIQFVTRLEEAFEDPNYIVTIFESYNGVLSKIKKELKKRNHRWEDVDEFAIRVKLRHLRDAKVTYQITDVMF